MWEFNCDVECDHCGEETTECFAFNPEEADQGGMLSSIREITCTECYEIFYASAYVTFDVSIHHQAKKKWKMK